MAVHKQVCLLVMLLFASVALAQAKVDVARLLRETTRVKGEVEQLLERARENPLERLHKGPIAPHATTAAELRAERRIGVMESPASASASAAAGPSSLLEASSTTSASTSASAATQWQEPMLNVPEPPERLFQAARLQFNLSRPSDVELRLRKVKPRPVIINPPRVQDADIRVVASEVLPRDPEADALLALYNAKYGVLDESGLPNPIPGVDVPPDDDLLPPDRERYTKTQREYMEVFDNANMFGFDPEKDSVQALDQQLASLWSKRWEYFAGQKEKAEEVLRRKSMQEQLFPIDPLFVAKQPSPDAAALLGDVYTYDDTPPVARVASIPQRENFVPQAVIFGPRVRGKAIDVADIAPPAGPAFASPEFKDEFRPIKGEIRVVAPALSPDAAANLARPRFYDEMNIDVAVPATLTTDKPLSNDAQRYSVVATNKGVLPSDPQLW